MHENKVTPEYVSKLLLNYRAKHRQSLPHKASGTTDASFSVVMCNLNEIKTIKWSLKSLKNQNVRPKEIIVVDGGSTDGSLEVAEALADKVLTEVKGIGFGRVYGMLVSQGKFICSADSDTIYPRHYLGNAFKCLSNPQVKAVTGPYKPISRSGFDLTAEAQGALAYILHLFPYIPGFNICFNKEAFVTSNLLLRPYWLRSIFGGSRRDISGYVRYALHPRWTRNMLVYTRLPTTSVSLKSVLKYLRTYLKEGQFVRQKWMRTSKWFGDQQEDMK